MALGNLMNFDRVMERLSVRNCTSTRTRPFTLKIGIAARRQMPAKQASPSLFRRDLRRASVELGIELARLLPAHHVERFNELADAINLGAEQPELDDLFITEVLGEIGIDLIFVDGMLACLSRSA